MPENRSRFVLLCQQSLAFGAGGRHRGPGREHGDPGHRRPAADAPVPRRRPPRTPGAALGGGDAPSLVASAR